MLSQVINARPSQKHSQTASLSQDQLTDGIEHDLDLGTIFYSGQYRGHNGFRWDPRQQEVHHLLGLDTDKVAKILAALGNKQRLDILFAVLQEPLSGSEIVERLNLGTTGQLYHHTKALLGADLLVQEERGGKYSLPAHRTLPLLLLLTAITDLHDTSHYIELTEARNNVEAYLGENNEGYDPHYLLWAVIDNSLFEHQAGYCTELNIVLHSDTSITVSDNGRGIPIQAFPQSKKTPVQAVLTELGHYNKSASVVASDGLKGINMPVVNALSEQLSVEVRREGKVFRQDFKHGIPQSELLVLGMTKETGTSITFKPNPDIFKYHFDKAAIIDRLAEIQLKFPNLKAEMLE
ncbi:ATP-binding protein [Bacillus sp. FJAT-28004]|uniref:ATP-binding protein n=1 Tax=Bacillus sp. FJAT-28004 TaxID=1679165 RepID=UPI001F2D41C8|nr:ATP-binding protein [Bacillus sp. FJAT-28004]